MKSLLIKKAIILSPLVLTACATSSDPHDGGFVSGIVGLSTQEYEKRVAEKELQHAEELGAQDDLRRRSEALKRERAELEQELETASNQVAVLEASIQRRRSELTQSRIGESEEERRLNEAEARVAALKVGLERTEPSELSVDELRAESQDAQSELQELDSLMDILGSGSL